MKRWLALVGATWGFLRIAALFFAIIIGQILVESPLSNLILLVLGAGSVGIITMYLELYRAESSLGVLWNPLRWSLASLSILGLTAVILAIAANLRHAETVAPASLVLMAVAALGDCGQFVIVWLAKPQGSPPPVESGT